MACLEELRGWLTCVQIVRVQILKLEPLQCVAAVGAAKEADEARARCIVSFQALRGWRWPAAGAVSGGRVEASG